jgi:excinuclease ABC subunit C
MNLAQKVEALPKTPGVYIMKGANGEVLYVGKANALSERVRSYFRAGPDIKTRALMARVHDLDYMVVASELEALILENNLIKQHRPKYNIVLRDDKNYPLLRLPIQEDYPRLSIVRRAQKDGALYFGPYVPAGGIHELIRTLRQIFPLPNCTIKIDGSAERACIEYEIKRCLAPCTGNQSGDNYREMIRQVRLFLSGDHRALYATLKAEMKSRAECLDFEAAAAIRDQIVRIERALSPQRITSTRMEEQDVLAIARSEDAADLQVLFIRGGMWVGRKDFFFEGDTPDEALYTAFIQQFYQREGALPPEIVTPKPLPDASLLSVWLTQQRGGPVRLLTPTRGRRLRLIELALENAQASLRNHLQTRASQKDVQTRLQTLLRLTRVPHRIEGYDISNIMGTSAVGSMVVFEGGIPQKADYRHFRIKTLEGANDFGMMAEVLSRRVAHIRKTGGVPPDLILIDGGAGQVEAVRTLLSEQGLGTVPLIGLAKARDEKKERVYLPKETEAIVLPDGMPETYLLMRIRDEAHRFAITYHRKIRNLKMLTSPLQEIEGIGAIRRRALLTHFGSLARIREATPDALSRIPSMNEKVAQKVYAAFHAS